VFSHAHALTVLRSPLQVKQLLGKHGHGQHGQDKGHGPASTAQPRPNAYIPDVLGIPKPYSAFAPFKPTEAGATMRHVRKPHQLEVVL
jgi:hypothetical protein